MQKHIVDDTERHFGWDNAIEPVLTIDPGETIEFQTLDAGGGQLDTHSTVEDVAGFDFSKVNPAFGPIYVDGAEPGDALEVTIVDLETEGWGWTANIPGFGLLADRFREPALHIWRFDAHHPISSEYGAGGVVPLRPFPGILGNAPPDTGCHSIVNPRMYGGNMDTRDLTEGSKLLLPIGVAGALFSCGDGHAAQGDGEVCGTAIESPMKMTLQFKVVKNARLKYPRFSTKGPVTNHFDQKGYEVTMGIGPDLMASAKIAVSDMVDFVAKTYKIDDIDAYMLLSVCADLRINEIVDAPNWVVSCYFPKIIFQP